MPQRSSSFDDRDNTTLGSDGFKAFGGFKPLKKAWTMVNPPTFLSPPTSDFKTSDILYRQHFNATSVPKGLLKKGLSLEGMEGSWIKSSLPVPPSLSPIPASLPNSSKIVIVVDCFSTGAMVAHKALEAGYSVVRIDSFDNPELAAMVASGVRTDYSGYFTYDGEDPAHTPEAALAMLCLKLAKLEGTVIAVIAGAETGVELADRLSEALSLLPGSEVLTNGSSDTECRRNKYLMGEKVRDAGIRAVMQCRATTWSEIQTFLDGWNPSPYNVIVKPMESGAKRERKREGGEERRGAVPFCPMHAARPARPTVLFRSD